MNNPLMTRKSRSLFLVVLGMGSLVLSSCGGPQVAPQAKTSAHSVLLNNEDQPLRDDFNRDQGFVRLLFARSAPSRQYPDGRLLMTEDGTVGAPSSTPSLSSGVDRK